MKPGETVAKRAVVDEILAKHDAATGGRRFNELLATASINDAIVRMKNRQLRAVRRKPSGDRQIGRQRLTYETEEAG